LHYCYCISERGSDTTDKFQHSDEEIDVNENDDIVNAKQYTVVNDKEARGIAFMYYLVVGLDFVCRFYGSRQWSYLCISGTNYSHNHPM